MAFRIIKRVVKGIINEFREIYESNRTFARLAKEDPEIVNIVIRNNTKLHAEWVFVVFSFLLIVVLNNSINDRVFMAEFLDRNINPAETVLSEFLDGNGNSAEEYPDQLLPPNPARTMLPNFQAPVPSSRNLVMSNSGYGILLNSDLTIALHPDRSLIGLNIASDPRVSCYTGIAEDLLSGRVVAGKRIRDYNGIASSAFFRRLSNGGYVGTITPQTSRNRFFSRALLWLAGFFMMLVLCSMLTMLHMRMYISDRASRIKSSFLANMSHEIRTPMNAVIGMTDLLQNEKLNERQMRFVNDIKSSSSTLLDIINDILDMSKIEAGKLELSPEHYSFSGFLDNINSMFQAIARDKNIEFKFETEGEIPQYLYGDDIRLRQVLVNICGNAVKFTSEGFVHLNVAAVNESVLFKITDTGTGIPANDLPAIFDAFTQADTGKNRNIKGTGLGLSISKQLVGMMGGSITVESDYGRGTVFTVIIPKVASNGDLIKQKETEHKKFYAPSCKVLIIDDNEVNLKVARGFLELFGISADTEADGFAAIEAVKQKKYDILFMDYMMPGIDGVETVKRIRKLGEEYKNLKIIALTANAVSGAREMFLSSGFDDFLSKPVEIEKLAAILYKWIPEDKIETHFVSQTGNEEKHKEDGFLYRLKGIGSINAEKGLNNFSGMEDMYRETLQLVYARIKPECEKMKSFLAKESLTEFAVSVHGVKSSLLTIGATGLSAAAYDLEMAAKSGDKHFCLTQYQVFFDQMTGLHEQLAGIFPEGKNENDLPKRNSFLESNSSAEADGDLLIENIQRAITAAGNLDNDLCLEAMTNLLNYDFGKITEQKLKRAIDSVKAYDYDQAVTILGRLSDLSNP